MTIGTLAEHLGVNPRTIRYYERVGLIPPARRSEGGYRLYAPADEERIRFIKSAQRLGLTLGEVKETLAFRERGERPCRYVAGLIEERLGEINQRLRELRAFKRDLAQLRERMRDEGGVERDGSYCHYIEHSPRAAYPSGSASGGDERVEGPQGLRGALTGRVDRAPSFG